MSFVATLTTDSGTVDDPTWSQVAHAIDALHRSTSTTVVLAARSGEHHLGIAGGKDDLCVVYFTEDTHEFWNLEDASKSGSARFVMIAGGQEGDFFETQCVPRGWAISAARAYFDHGTRASDLSWTRR